MIKSSIMLLLQSLKRINSRSSSAWFRISLTWCRFGWCSNPFREPSRRCRPWSRGLSYGTLSSRRIWCSSDLREKNSRWTRTKKVNYCELYLPIKFASSGCELPWSSTMFDVEGQSIEKWFAKDFAGSNLKVNDESQKNFVFGFFRYRSNFAWICSVMCVQEWNFWLIKWMNWWNKQFNLD